MQVFCRVAGLHQHEMLSCMLKGVCNSSLPCDLCSATVCRARKEAPSQAALQAAGAARTALRAQCTEVPLEAVERYNLLKKFSAMLTANHEASQDAAVVARQHVEYLDPPVMAQALSKARFLSCFHPPTDSRLLQKGWFSLSCLALSYHHMLVLCSALLCHSVLCLVLCCHVSNNLCPPLLNYRCWSRKSSFGLVQQCDVNYSPFTLFFLHAQADMQ